MVIQDNNFDRLENIHPGEILKEEFLDPLNISQYKIAKDIHVTQTAISEIVRGIRGISTDMAIRLSKYFDTSVNFWLNLQNDYDIEEEFLSKKETFEVIKKYNEAKRYPPPL